MKILCERSNVGTEGQKRRGKEEKEKDNESQTIVTDEETTRREYREKKWKSRKIDGEIDLGEKRKINRKTERWRKLAKSKTEIQMIITRKFKS